MITTVIRSLLLGATLLLGGCESNGSQYGSSTRVSVGYYGGSGWYDPYYRNRCCYNGVVVRPPHHRPPGHRPPGSRPGRPAHLPARSRPVHSRPARRR
jgi:hypothetical protein